MKYAFSHLDASRPRIAALELGLVATLISVIVIAGTVAAAEVAGWSARTLAVLPGFTAMDM